MLKKEVTYQQETDEQIVDRYRGGEKEAVGLLFDRYSHLVIGVCLKYLKERETARDATTDIFEQLIGKLKKHKVERFRPWLYSLSRNHCLMILRKRKTGPQMVNGHFKEAEADEFSIQLKRTEEKRYQELEKAISTLKSTQADCIRYFYLQGMSYQEVGKKTGLDIRAVKSNIQNGKRNLKNTLIERHGSEYR